MVLCHVDTKHHAIIKKEVFCSCWEHESLFKDPEVTITASFNNFYTREAAEKYGWKYIRGEWFCKDCVKKSIKT